MRDISYKYSFSYYSYHTWSQKSLFFFCVVSTGFLRCLPSIVSLFSSRPLSLSDLRGRVRSSNHFPLPPTRRCSVRIPRSFFFTEILTHNSTRQCYVNEWDTHCWTTGHRDDRLLFAVPTSMQIPKTMTFVHPLYLHLQSLAFDLIPPNGIDLRRLICCRLVRALSPPSVFFVHLNFCQQYWCCLLFTRVQDITPFVPASSAHSSSISTRVATFLRGWSVLYVCIIQCMYEWCVPPAGRILFTFSDISHYSNRESERDVVVLAYFILVLYTRPPKTSFAVAAAHVP